MGDSALDARELEIVPAANGSISFLGKLQSLGVQRVSDISLCFEVSELIELVGMNFVEGKKSFEIKTPLK